MFDEPSSYLDVRQRLRAAQAIRDLCEEDKYVIAVEHDLSVLDYLSDFVCCLYGKPGAYGVVTAPFSVREGINIFLAGFVPTENLRFRQSELSFKVAENVQNQAEEEQKRHSTVSYPAMTKVLGDFTLHVKEGGFAESEIIVMLGQNGTGQRQQKRSEQSRPPHCSPLASPLCVSLRLPAPGQARRRSLRCWPGCWLLTTAARCLP